MGSVTMQVKRILKMIFNNRRAMGTTVSAVILSSATIALGLVVFAWTQSRSSDYVHQYSETMHGETARLGERLTAEYVVYDKNSNETRIYLLNWGTTDHIEIQSVYIGRGSWHLAASTFTLRFFNGTLIPDQDLDVGEEGYIVMSSSLDDGGYYYLRIVTVRGAVFDSTFVA